MILYTIPSTTIYLIIVCIRLYTRSIYFFLYTFFSIVLRCCLSKKEKIIFKTYLETTIKTAIFIKVRNKKSQNPSGIIAQELIVKDFRLFPSYNVIVPKHNILTNPSSNKIFKKIKTYFLIFSIFCFLSSEISVF